MLELSTTEQEIMSLIWGSETNLTFVQILDYFNQQLARDWKKQTLSTYIKRLVDKGFITATKSGRTYIYNIVITKSQYNTNKAQTLIQNSFDGSLSSLVMTLYDGQKISKADFIKLKDFVQSFGEEE